MPLEPIEENDLDLKNKFIEKNPEAKGSVESAVEEVAGQALEQKAERLEGNMEKDDSYSKIVAKIKTTSPQVDPSQVASDAQSVGQEIDIESRVKNLVDIAMQKGVAHAVKVARHVDDNYVLDKFHDKMMADELHDALMEKGLIKDV